MLRPSRSDPVLIKPSYSDFLKNWNNRKQEAYSYLSSETVDQLYGIFVTIADSKSAIASSSVPGPSATFYAAHNYARMSKSDRIRREKKLAFQLKRRNSVLMANCKEVLSMPGGMRRAWSSVELRNTYCHETTTTKRVSFSINLPRSSSPDRRLQIERGAYDLGPAKIPARPILRRTTFSGGKTSLEHMDFDSFTAWRRGSRMSDDCDKCKRKSLKEEEALRKNRKEKSSDDLCWLLRIMKHGFDSCFQRRRVTPSPPPGVDESTTTTSSGSEGIVISMVNAE